MSEESPKTGEKNPKKIPINFRVQDGDERVILRRLYKITEQLRNAFDPEKDGRIFLYNTRDEYLGKRCVMDQLKDVARRSRESMVAFALQICGHLAGIKKIERYPKAGAYFFGCAIERQLERLLKYPRHQDAIIDEAFQLKRNSEFYGMEFWSSEVIIAWIVVHVIQEWYDLDLDTWAERLAEEIDLNAFRQ